MVHQLDITNQLPALIKLPSPFKKLNLQIPSLGKRLTSSLETNIAPSTAGLSSSQGPCYQCTAKIT